MLNSNKILNYFKRIIWDIDVATLPWWQGWPLRLSRLVYVIIKDLTDRQITLRAMSLVFTTLLSMVPLLAVSFSVLKAFGVHDKAEPMVLNLLAHLGEQGVELTGRIIGFVDNIDARVLGLLGVALLIYTAVSLVYKVERSFNYTWHVEQSRSFARRFSSYLTVIMIGPLMVFAALGLIATLKSTTVVQGLVAIEPFGSLYSLLGTLAPYVLIIAAFSFMYAFIPNTRVTFSAAVSGGIVAGLLWNFSGWAFATFVVSSSNYQAIYSSFAILLIFMIWLYVSWSILLIGASIAFYQQNPEYLVAGRYPSVLSNRMRERLSLLVLALVGRNFYQRLTPWTLEGLARALNAPIQAVEKVVMLLEQGQLLTRNDDEPAAYIPARPFETTGVHDALLIIRAHNEPSYGSRLDMTAVLAVEPVLSQIDAAVSSALEGMMLKDLVAPPGVESSIAPLEPAQRPPVVRKC